jgi:hypothetical protein
MQRLTITHVTRWQQHRHKVGEGHLYQGRFKSFPVASDEHFYQVLRYAPPPSDSACKPPFVPAADHAGLQSAKNSRYGPVPLSSSLIFLPLSSSYLPPFSSSFLPPPALVRKRLSVPGDHAATLILFPHGPRTRAVLCRRIKV